MTFFYPFAAATFRLVYSVIYRHTVTFEFDPKTLPGAAIVAPNHVSYLDPQLISGSWPGSLQFFAGEHLFKGKLFGWLLRNLQTHPIPKGKELAVLRAALQFLKRGQKVVLFPEGTRSGDGTLKELRDGVSFLALQAQCPIIPCYVHGAYAAWPRTKKFPSIFGVRTRVIFGSPIFPVNEQKEPRTKQEMTKLLQQALVRMSRQ